MLIIIRHGFIELFILLESSQNLCASCLFTLGGISESRTLLHFGSAFFDGVFFFLQLK